MINLATNTIGATRKAGGAGPTPWDPSLLTGLVGWYRADQLTLNSGYVSDWFAYFGPGASLVQPNGAKQPNWTATGINGLPSVYHDTNGQGLSMDAPAKLMDYANTDDFFVLAVESMELNSSANTGTRDSFDIIGWAGGSTASAYHGRSKTLVQHSMGLIGASPSTPNTSMTGMFSPPLAAGDPHWWAYGARRSRRVEVVRNTPGGSAGTAAELSIAFDTTAVNVGGFSVVSNVITVPATGKYTIGATAVFVNVNATGNASLGLKLNGGAYTAYSSNTPVTPTTARSFTKTLDLTVGDTIEIFTYWDGTITTRDYVPAPGACNVRFHTYEYYTMDGGITPYSVADNQVTNLLPASSANTATYTLRAATGGGATTGATFNFTPIGYISEIIVCKSIPDSATFTQLNNYLYSRYALGSNI